MQGTAGRTYFAALVIVLLLLGSTAHPRSIGAEPSAVQSSDPIVGDWNVTYVDPAVVAMSLSNGQYTATAKTPVRVTGSSCDLPSGTVIATFSSVGSPPGGNEYAGQHGLWSISDCAFANWISADLTLHGDGETLTAVLGGRPGTATFTRSAGATAAGPARPNMARAVPSPLDISTDPEVVGTNLTLAALTLFVILVAAQLFNATLVENKDATEAWLAGPLSVLRSITGRTARPRARLRAMRAIESSRLERFGWPLFILVLTVLIYGFAEPGFGPNSKSAVLALSLLLTVGLVTYVVEGGKALLARTRYQQHTGVRPFPFAIGVAIINVIFCRAIGFEPGIIYGFVGASVFLTKPPASFTDHEQAVSIYIPSVALLVLSVLAWFAIIPFRTLAESTDIPPAAFGESTAATLFVTGMFATVIGMIPLSFFDGQKIWKWNRWLWTVPAVGALGLCWHVLINEDGSYLDALSSTVPLAAFIVLAMFSIFCVGFWLYFKLRRDDDADLIPSAGLVGRLRLAKWFPRITPGSAWLPKLAGLGLLAVVVAVGVVVLSTRSGDGQPQERAGAAPQPTTSPARSEPTSSPQLFSEIVNIGVVVPDTADVEPVATAGAAPDSAERTYTIALPPGDEDCGFPSINGLQLAIQGDSATLSSSASDLLRGSATQTDRRLSIQLAGAQGREWGVDLSGELDDAGNISGQSKSGGIHPGGQTGWSCDGPFMAYGTGAPSAPPPTPAARIEADALRAAIQAHSPGIQFDPECSATNPGGPCATGSWPAEVLASGIAGVSVHNDQEGIGTWYGRMADGTWVYWFATQNIGGPLTSLPGDMIVCADGDGLNLRAEPSTSAPVLTLIPDGTVVRGDRFVMTDGATPGGTMPPHPDGWYHIVSPREGWAYDRYLLGYANGVTTCIETWWP